jgi:uncharacterized protein
VVQHTAARALWLFAIAILALAPHAPALAKEPVKVVYHITDSETQAALALGNIRNHLRADPKAKITVVGLFKGIDFMLEGAADKNGNPYNIPIEELARQGVQFKICQNSMVFFKVDPSKVLPQVKPVPSGVAEIARLQSQERYAYIKP